MPDKAIEIKLDNAEVNAKLIEVARHCEDMLPLMKNIAGIMAHSTEENFKNEGRPDKWQELAESTIKHRKKIGHYPGQILQVTTQLASSISTMYDNNSAVIGSNLAYAAIHQLGGQAGKNNSVEIPARPYLQLVDEDYTEIIDVTEKYLKI